MLAFVIVLQVFVALFLILVVLLQPGNRGGAGAAMGGAGSDSVFGARGANTFLSKITFGAAVCFMITNFALSYMSSTLDRSSVVKELEKEGVAPVKNEPNVDTEHKEPIPQQGEAIDAGKQAEQPKPNGEAEAH